MCHDWWNRRELRRRNRFDEELRYLLDEQPDRSERAPDVEYVRMDELPEAERPRVEADTR